MKKIAAIVMTGLLILGLCACGGQNAKESADSAAADNTTVDNTVADNTVAVNAGSVLVVYFSNTGHTKAIAEHIADGTGAALYEITPETLYTDADLNYNDNNSRSTVEMNNPSARPAITGTVENFGQYSTVYIGYPIWWGEAPRILDTFVESYDFTGKTVIPFCTSASSSIGSSAKTLESLAGTGNWKTGQRFSGSESETDVTNWIKGL